MFDIGFWELSVIGVIGLLVLGPERLPGVARVVGGYIRKARQTWAGVRSEIAAELAADEFKQAMRKPAEEFKAAMAEPMSEMESLSKSAKESLDFSNKSESVPNGAESSSEAADLTVDQAVDQAADESPEQTSGSDPTAVPEDAPKQSL